MSNMNGRQRKARRRIKEQTELMAWLTAGRIETAETGAPYVACGTPGTDRSASICWFESSKTFGVFCARNVRRTFGDAKLAAACAKRIVAVGAETYASWIAGGGSEEQLAAATKRWEEKKQNNSAFAPDTVCAGA